MQNALHALATPSTPGSPQALLPAWAETAHFFLDIELWGLGADGTASPPSFHFLSL